MLGRQRFFLRKLRLPIRPGDLVVDVGSGGDPHPRADVLVERNVEAGDRTNGFLRSAPTVIADIQHLPFREGAFGFAICAHVLEHVPDPAVAAAELGRVAERGYIETPSELHERLFPMGFHKWFVMQRPGGLRFVAKPAPYLDERTADLIRPLWDRDRAFMRWFWSRTRDLFVQHHWTGTPQVEVVGRPAQWFPLEDEVAHGMGDAPAVAGRKRQLYAALAAIRYRRRRA